MAWILVPQQTSTCHRGMSLLETRVMKLALADQYILDKKYNKVNPGGSDKGHGKTERK